MRDPDHRALFISNLNSFLFIDDGMISCLPKGHHKYFIAKILTYVQEIPFDKQISACLMMIFVYISQAPTKYLGRKKKSYSLNFRISNVLNDLTINTTKK